MILVVRLCRFNGGNVLQAQIEDRLFEDLELLNLAGDRCGKALHELDVTRCLEVGQACAAEVANLVLGDDGAGSNFHPGGDLFAELGELLA